MPSVKRPKRVSTELGELVCFICTEPGNDSNLCAARAWNAKTNKLDKTHVNEFTETIRNMALAIDNKIILAKLSSGDVSSNELY